MNMNNKLKLIINSSPRSGQAWLEFIVRQSLNFDFHSDNDNILTRIHVPVVLNAKFDDIYQTIILRDPFDLIPSIVTKTTGGFGSNIISGVSMPHEINNVPSLERLILDQFGVYTKYANGINNNINNLIPFTFEQVTTDISFTISTLMSETGYNLNILQNNNLNSFIELAREKIVQHDKGNVGYNNPVPINKKPDVYYEAKDLISKLNGFEDIVDLYNKTKNNIYARQQNI